MKIIYDKEKAIQTKQKIDEKFAEKKPSAKKRALVLCTCLIAVTGIVFCLFRQLLVDITDPTLVIVVEGLQALTAAVLLFVVAAIAARNFAKKVYPEAVKYHVLTTQQDKTVLNTDAYITALLHDKGQWGELLYITLDLEDANHAVTREGIQVRSSGRSFGIQYRTDISEETFDLDTKTVYKPYTK